MLDAPKQPSEIKSQKLRHLGVWWELRLQGVEGIMGPVLGGLVREGLCIIDSL